MSEYDPKACGARCDACPLSGQPVVPPAGPLTLADMAIVGEAPGMNEVKFKKPFVGASGVKLDEILWNAGMRRQSVWITNGLLCRPEVPGELGKKRYDVKLYMAWLRKENARRKKAKEAPLESPFACCAPRLYLELQTLDAGCRSRGRPNGVVVVPMGNFALGTLSGKPGSHKGILKWRGSVIQYA